MPAAFFISAFGAWVGGFTQLRVDMLQERVITTSRITRVRSESDDATGSVGAVAALLHMPSEVLRARNREAMVLARTRVWADRPGRGLGH
jgi:hypothetical protein